MLRKRINCQFILLIIFFGTILLFPSFVVGKSADAIAMRIIPNPDHYSALFWYKNKVQVKGSPQSLAVDGYEAIRDGRTVYVDAANIELTGPTFFTNIYIISYNQQAEKPTEDIFGQLLANWRFNNNLNFQTGQCTENTSISCLNGEECTGSGYCTSYKAKAIRETIRLARLNDVKAAIENYKTDNGHYPIIAAGSYIANRTISVWPSWQETLGKILQGTLPVDPINKLANCGTQYDKTTCWDKATVSFAWQTELAAGTVPNNNFVFLYSTDNKGESYKLCSYSDIGFIQSPFVCNANCVPNCLIKECGADGCSGSCGSCGPGETCVNYICKASCNTQPGCRSSLTNGYITQGYCLSGNCYNCNIGYNWNDSSGSCVSVCVPDGCNGNCPYSCTPADDPDCAGTGCCGDRVCTAGSETNATCPGDCPIFCTDNDNDGYGGPASSSCLHPQEDCNDNNPNIHPGAAEICGNGIDEDCSGADLPCVGTCTDSDNDGYGNPASSACPHQELDCKDFDANIHPGATEVCDGIDNNCDNIIDENCDSDLDNYCSCDKNFVYGSNLTLTCPGTNTTDATAIANTCDCNDSNANVHPGAIEICGNGDDEDCSGADLPCSATCSATPGCRISAPTNASIVAGTCASGSCYACNSGYTWNGSVCAINCSAVPGCRSSAPANSTVNTGYCASGNCYTCNSGYTWNSTICEANCTTPAGCRTSLANASVVSGYCASGNCYACNGGYYWDGSSCISSAPVCSATPGCRTSAPVNASIVAGTCASGSCYACNSGYTWNGSACEANCITPAGCRTSLANASVVSGYCASGSCYACNSGYTWNGSVCAKNCSAAPGCRSSAPTNATANTDYCASGSCYACNSGYLWDGSNCSASCTFPITLPCQF